MKPSRRSLFIALGIVGLGLTASCASYDPDDREEPAPGISGAGFKPVALMLVDRCGSIDCHGSKYRNFRLYGYGSQRLDPAMRPGTNTLTTDAEVNENYSAVVSLEPKILQQVIREGGASPDRLTLMRKAREHESHKGGKRIVEGDNADICIQSWLQSQVREENCTLALSTPR